MLTGNNLRIIRAMVNMTQADLAAKAECSATAITEYENGKRELRSDTIRKLCAALGVRITYGVKGTDITGP